MSSLNKIKTHTRHNSSITSTKYDEQDDFKDFFNSENTIMQERPSQPSYRINLKIKRNAEKSLIKNKQINQVSAQPSVLSNQINKQQYPQISNLKNIMKSGKYIYMNVLGKQQNHIRAISPQQLENNYQINDGIVFYGCEFPNLTNQEKEVLNYLNHELQTKTIQHEIKKLIKDKFIKVNKKVQKSNLQKDLNQIKQPKQIKSYINSKKSVKQPSQISNLNLNIGTFQPSNISFITSETPCSQIKKIATQEPKFGNVINFKQKFNNRIRSMLQQESEQRSNRCNINKSRLRRGKNEECENMNRWVKQQRQANKAKSFDRSEIKLQNIQKYNMEYTDYLKKKSNRKIQRDKIQRIMNRKQNIIQQYQQHLLMQLDIVGSKNKCIRKGFQQINSQIRRIRKL